MDVLPARTSWGHESNPGAARSRAQRPGSYSARVGNAGGNITTSNATLRVNIQQRLGLAARRARMAVWKSSRAMPMAVRYPPVDLPTFEAQVSTDLVNWQVFPDGLSVTNGSLLLRDPEASRWPQRFYPGVEH